MLKQNLFELDENNTPEDEKRFIKPCFECKNRHTVFLSFCINCNQINLKDFCN